MSGAKKPDDPEPVRMEWITATRAVAIVSVVCQHAADSVVWYSDWLISRPPWWFAGAVFDAIAAGVPLFTMVSGALLLNPKSESTLAAFLHRRLGRILPPYLVWCVVYTVWKTRNDKLSFTWDAFAYEVVFGGAYYHLWFIPMLLGLYVLTPLVRTAIARGPSSVLWFTAWAWAVWFVVLRSLFSHLGWNEGASESYVAYFLYFLLGYLLSTLRQSRTILVSSACVWLGSAAVIIMGTHAQAMDNGGTLTEETGDNNFYPAEFVLSVAALLILRNIDWPRLFRIRRLAMTIEAIAAASFTIYLLHPILLELGGYIPFMRSDWTHPAVAIPLATFFAVVGCVSYWWLIRALAKPAATQRLARTLAP